MVKFSIYLNRRVFVMLVLLCPCVNGFMCSVFVIVCSSPFLLTSLHVLFLICLYISSRALSKVFEHRNFVARYRWETNHFVFAKVSPPPHPPPPPPPPLHISSRALPKVFEHRNFVARYRWETNKPIISYLRNFHPPPAPPPPPPPPSHPFTFLAVRYLRYLSTGISSRAIDGKPIISYLRCSSLTFVLPDELSTVYTIQTHSFYFLFHRVFVDAQDVDFSSQTLTKHSQRS